MNAKTVFAVLGLLSTVLAAKGASVLWGVLDGADRWSDDGVNYAVFSASSPNGLPVRPAVGIRAAMDRETGSVTVGSELWLVDLEHFDCWKQVSGNDIVDETSTRHLDSYFFKSGLDAEAWDASDSVEHAGFAPFRFVLGFATGEETWPEDGGSPVFEDVYYGWALFECRGGRNPQVYLVESAMSLVPNRGIYAGTATLVPVPEPSAAALALFGAAVLARRRKRRQLRPDSFRQ